MLTKRKNRIREQELLLSFLHMLAGGCTLKDVLPFLCEYHPEFSYYVVSDTRQVCLGSETITKDVVAAGNAIPIGQIADEQVFLDYEKSSIPFPKGCKAIQVVRLTKNGTYDMFLMILLPGYFKFEGKALLELFIVASNYLLDTVLKDSLQVTLDLKLRSSREELLADLENASEDAFFAMIQIIGSLPDRKDSIRQTLNGKVYQYSQNTYCILFIRENLCEAVRSLEDYLYLLLRQYDVETRCIVSKVEDAAALDLMYGFESELSSCPLNEVIPMQCFHRLPKSKLFAELF